MLKQITRLFEASAGMKHRRKIESKIQATKITKVQPKSFQNQDFWDINKMQKMEPILATVRCVMLHVNVKFEFIG